MGLKLSFSNFRLDMISAFKSIRYWANPISENQLSNIMVMFRFMFMTIFSCCMNIKLDMNVNNMDTTDVDYRISVKKGESNIR